MRRPVYGRLFLFAESRFATAKQSFLNTRKEWLYLTMESKKGKILPENRRKNGVTKPLLVMAHRGEAQMFIKNWQMSRVDFPFAEMFEQSDALLLICGEGMQNATAKTAAVCGAFRDQICEVLNFGIAGALDERLSIGDYYSIRTAYGELSGEAVFQTFTSADATATIDCISASRRVRNGEFARKLLPFAPIVDRELWGIASICKMFRLPFRSFKLISDVPAVENDCAPIAENAAVFSEKLFSFAEKTMPNSESGFAEKYEFTFPEQFHVTFSQRKQIENMMQSLCLKHRIAEIEILEKTGIAKIAHFDISPKQRTALLIESLNDMLNPFNALLKQRLKSLCEPLENAGARIKFARDFEDDSIEVTAKFGHPRHLQAFRTALESFDFPAVQRLLNGDFSEIEPQPETENVEPSLINGDKNAN